jgi:hypothetical protein
MAVILAGCASGATTPGPNDGASLDFDKPVATIVVDDAGIQPQRLDVRVDDAVTVVNRGTKDHGLTSKTIDTGTMRPGETTTVFFTETGTIDVADRADASHTARIEVAPKASS